MRNISKLLLIFLCATFTSQAQATSQVTLSWKASVSSTTTAPGTVSVFRAAGVCPASGLGTLSYALLTATAPAAGPYVDSTVVNGSTYCYYVGATINGVSSGPSNTAQASTAIVPAPPTNLTTVTVTVSVPPN